MKKTINKQADLGTSQEKISKWPINIRKGTQAGQSTKQYKQNHYAAQILSHQSG